MERFLAICHPLHLYAMSGFKRAVRIILTLWIISFLSAIPFGLYSEVHYLDYPKGKIYFILFLHIHLYSFYCYIFILYYIIYVFVILCVYDAPPTNGKQSVCFFCRFLNKFRKIYYIHFIL